jgi:hypothetical protein
VTAGALSVSGLAATALVVLAVPTGVIMAVIDESRDRRAPVDITAPAAWTPAAGVVAERAGASQARDGPERKRAGERLHVTGGTGSRVQTEGYGKRRDQAELSTSPGADGGAGDETIPVAAAEPLAPPTPADGAQPGEPASSNGALTPVGRPDPTAPATAGPADPQDVRQNTSAEPPDVMSSNGELRTLGRLSPSAPAAVEPADGQGVRQDASAQRTQPLAAPAVAKIPEPARTNGRDTPPAPAKPPSPGAGRQPDPARLPDRPGPDGRATPGKPADHDRRVTPANPSDPTQPRALDVAEPRRTGPGTPRPCTDAGEPPRSDGRPTSVQPDGHAEMPPAGSPEPRANAAPVQAAAPGNPHHPSGLGVGSRAGATLAPAGTSPRSEDPSSPAPLDKSGG